MGWNGFINGDGDLFAFLRELDLGWGSLSPASKPPAPKAPAPEPTAPDAADFDDPFGKDLAFGEGVSAFGERVLTLGNGEATIGFVSGGCVGGVTTFAATDNGFDNGTDNGNEFVKTGFGEGTGRGAIKIGFGNKEDGMKCFGFGGAIIVAVKTVPGTGGEAEEAEEELCFWSTRITNSKKEHRLCEQKEEEKQQEETHTLIFLGWNR